MSEPIRKETQAVTRRKLDKELHMRIVRAQRELLAAKDSAREHGLDVNIHCGGSMVKTHRWLKNKITNIQETTV